jgi:hypothetical protein
MKSFQLPHRRCGGGRCGRAVSHGAASEVLAPRSPLLADPVGAHFLRSHREFRFSAGHGFSFPDSARDALHCFEIPFCSPPHDIQAVRKSS